MKQHVRWVYDADDLGEAVRRVRRERGLSQSALARRINVNRMTVSRLENGEAVSMETTLHALSECGYALAVAPKFSRLRLADAPDAAPEAPSAQGSPRG